MRHRFLVVVTVLVVGFVGVPTFATSAAERGSAPVSSRAVSLPAKVKPRPTTKKAPIVKKAPKPKAPAKAKVTKKPAKQVAVKKSVKKVVKPSWSSRVVSKPAPTTPARLTPPEARSAAPPATPTENVRMNGITLSDRQLQDFESQYGARPRPGSYWYDRTSGLYGTTGEGSSGFLFPGHEFGTLAADASSGSTGVFFNGRELTSGEVAIIDRIISMPSPPGRYWFDALGNVGAEGIDVPLINLYATARTSGGGGGGGGGDNFWSSRFSAGNYYTDASGAPSQGYVSVPGYGPVGYGF